jgi:chromosome segregation protein
MPLRLKYLELQGYKTFASRTQFKFSEGVTAIVGPNGSGKSNIADSIRWVLGEQSFHLLRGKKTEDMIFTGSELRPRSGMASATILFDNSDGWLPIDYLEVAVTRRAYRDGQNEYLLNGQRVRLKDVSELLSQSGLAERTYTVIGQGTVDAALAIRADERRRLFEEAAGIGLHRSRREEAIRRLDTTRRNIERIQDILSELHPRLKSLEKQARRADEYKQVSSDLKIVLRDWYGYHWHRAQKELTDAREIVRSVDHSVNDARERMYKSQKDLNDLRDEIKKRRFDLNAWHHDMSDLHRTSEEIQRSLAVADERESMIQDQILNLSNQRSQANEDLEIYLERITLSDQEIERLESEYKEAKIQQQVAVDELNQIQSKRKVIDEEVVESRNRLTSLNNTKSQFEIRMGEREDQIIKHQKNIETMTQVFTKISSQLESENEQVEILRKNLEDVKTQRKELDEAIFLLRSQILEQQKEKQRLTLERTRVMTTIARIDTESLVLRQAEAALTGYAQGPKIILKAVKDKKLSGIKGILNTYLVVPEVLETAITAALGEHLDAILVNDEIEGVLDYLLSQDARGVLLPVKNLRSRHYPGTQVEADGILGVASDLVNFPDEIKVGVELLLGNVIVVETRQVAQKIVDQLIQNDEPAIPCLRFVTLAGEIYSTTGVIIASGFKHQGQVMFGRSRQIKELEEKLKANQEKIQQYELLIADLDREIQNSIDQETVVSQTLRNVVISEEKISLSCNQSMQTVSAISQQIEWHKHQIEQFTADIKLADQDIEKYRIEIKLLDEQILIVREQLIQKTKALAEISSDDLVANVAQWNTTVAVINRSLEEARKLAIERKSVLVGLERSRDNYNNRRLESEKELEDLTVKKQELNRQAKENDIKIASLQALIIPAENVLEPAETRLLELEKKEQDSRQFLNIAEQHASQARIGFAHRQDALDSLKRRVEEDFGLVSFEYEDDVSGPTPLPFEGMVEQLPRIMQLGPDIEETIRRLRAQIKRIGPVNTELLSEYQDVLERYQFLNSQVVDLEAAEQDVRLVIQELDLLMQKEFRETFDAVAIQFREIFSRLFGGGSAKLILTDPDELIDTGVEIEARLPGRRMQGLSLLSGGERSLTAVALVFALLKVSPTPFCLLDEVDAMLDEVNVHRFRELLRELSQNTQFVIVTHNRNTVQVADIIYGVTLGRDLSSQVLSLRLDEVGKMVGDEA